MTPEKYEAVIGLEVHAQLLTQSKLFCGDSASFGAEPNTHVSPVTLAHPGTLPKMNSRATEYAVKLGLALNCDIVKQNYFARKNYFYPDLPKGYQVSQHTTPICKNGFVSINLKEGEKNIILNRIHIEEDAGKSIHDIDDDYTCIDLNRAGVPLLEIVTEPCINSGDEAYAYLTELRRTVRWIDICDGNMEEGSMRCDANISIRLKGEKKLGTKVEVKNLNSIRNVKRAIEAELERLVSLAENNETIIQETRGYDAAANTTYSMRTKEAADDYRYFPEPDLTPFVITEEYISSIQKQMPLLPAQLQQQMIHDYGLSVYDAAQVCTDKETAHFFTETVKYTKNYKAAANWLQGPVRNYLNEKEGVIEAFPVVPKKLAELIDFTETGRVSFSNAAGKILPALIAVPSVTVEETASSLNLLQENNEETLVKWVDDVLANMPDKVKEYKSGKKGLVGLFAGEVKKLSKGKADMQQVTALLQQKLNN